MIVRGDIEHVNLQTGERFQRVSGNGESRLERIGATETMSSEDHYRILKLEERVAQLEAANVQNTRLGPKPPCGEETAAALEEALKRIPVTHGPTSVRG